MATLYQVYSTINTLRRSINEMALTWRAGDSILLLGTTVAFVEWLTAYLNDSDIQGVQAIYALADDIAQLSSPTTATLNLDAVLSDIWTDEQWVTFTQNTDNKLKFDKIVTIAR